MANEEKRKKLPRRGTGSGDRPGKWDRTKKTAREPSRSERESEGPKKNSVRALGTVTCKEGLIPGRLHQAKADSATECNPKLSNPLQGKSHEMSPAPKKVARMGPAR
jgi:hypothetical protein